MNSTLSLLTIFGNIRVEGEQKYSDLETTISSIQTGPLSSVQWVLNLRGSLAEKAEALIRKRLGSGPHIFRIEDERGWHYVTKRLLEYVKTPLLYSFLEDHCFSGKEETLIGVLCEMISRDVDHLMSYRYSADLLLALETKVPLISADYLSYVDLNQESVNKRNAVLKEFSTLGAYNEYLIGLPGFFKAEFYRKRINSFKLAFAQYNEKTPFDFEVSCYDQYVLPLRFGYSKAPMFTCIDDDFGIPGTSLVSKGELVRARRVDNEELKRTDEVAFARIHTSESAAFLFKYSKHKGRFGFLRPEAVSNTATTIEFLSRVVKDKLCSTTEITHAIVIAGCSGLVPLIFLSETKTSLRLIAVEQQLDSYMYLLSNLELRKQLTSTPPVGTAYPMRYPYPRFDTPTFIADVQGLLEIHAEPDIANKPQNKFALYVGDIYNYQDNIFSLLWLISISSFIILLRPEVVSDHPAFIVINQLIVEAGFHRCQPSGTERLTSAFYPDHERAKLPAFVVYSRD